MKNLAIIGGGSWGTALAIVLAPRFTRVRLWVFEADLATLGVKVHDTLPSRSLLVEVPGKAVGALGDAGFVEAGMTGGPLFRVAPDLGRVISNSQNWLASDPANLVIPGLVIFVIVLAFNLFGDALRDALDPKSSK